MVSIHNKTLEDLEFLTVIAQTSEMCITDLGKEAVLNIVPFTSNEACLVSLNLVNEFVASFENENRIPNHGFDAINDSLKLLDIENSCLEINSFRRVLSISETTRILLKFFKKFKEYYVYLNVRSEEIDFTEDVSEAIKKIIDKYGDIYNDASPDLAIIRKRLHAVKSKINGSFISALQKYSQLDYLDEIRETIVDNRRVLAVSAMYRRKVNGMVMGNSKTGSIVYIEPQATLDYSNELSNLQYEEQEEITRILKELTDFLRPYKPLLVIFQKYLTQIDCLYAKAKYAIRLGAILPVISKKKRLYLRDAYHPLLLISNNRLGEKTYPQTIELQPTNRIIVISGPNAGGKSITLKTVGLLQIMLQSGMLIPVHVQSEVCFFDKILTDIGDNQSIENQLSTYSYRLKKMNQFLKKCNKKTLFLIDEFGTGSDPELGGALAETFLEVFYEREAFGIITTHYANLKLLANELPHATNANMQFDSKTLEPLYKLFLGEAGSSFTFEVAQKNGIPYSLINRSKKKIARGKIRFDKTIANLQKERSKLRKTSESLKNEEDRAKEESKNLEEINVKIQEKLESYQELYDSNQRLIYLGRKINALAESYFNNKQKKQLVDEFLKIIAVENSKRKKVIPAEKKVQKIKKHIVNQEVEKEIAVIRKKKKKAKTKQILIEKNKPKITLKLGDQVRMIDGRAIGTIDKLEKNKAIVNYGIFTTHVSVDELEKV